MRPNTETQFRQTGNMVAKQSVKMTVDENNIQHIMSVLTDLYSDPMMAVIREYSTNGLDSHIAAGVDKPIQVSLPGPFDRSFQVQDYGVGLSVDDLINVVSKYGLSTKRDNNNESGMLGLGFKAGLTYTDQFSVIAVKDGVKTIAIVKRDEDGAGVVDIIDTVSTDESNGVLIKVAVKETSLFNRRAKEFFRFWDKGSVLVDGVEPEPVAGLRIDNDIIVVTDSTLSSDYVVMGNIGYRVDNRVSRRLPYGYNVVARVGMGDVNFTPNREALHYTPRTEETLGKLSSRVSEGLRKSAQSEIDKCSTHYEAMIAAQHWHRIAQGRQYTYRGIEIPRVFKEDCWVYNPNAYRYVMSRESRLDVSTLTNSLQVTGYENEQVSSTVRRKVKQYLADNSIGVKYVIFVKDRVGGKWTEGLPSADYSVIKAIRLNNGPRAKGRSVGEPVRCWVDGKIASHPVDQVPGKAKVLFSPAQDVSGRDLVAALGSDITFVELAKNRWDKFMRENTGTKSIDDALKEALNKIVNDMSMSDRLFISGARYRLDCLKGLDDSRIEDPDLAAVVRGVNANKNREFISRYRYVANAMSAIDIAVPTVKSGVEGVLDKYPLLKYDGDADREHIYNYVNHFYKESKQ